MEGILNEETKNQNKIDTKKMYELDNIDLRIFMIHELNGMRVVHGYHFRSLLSRTVGNSVVKISRVLLGESRGEKPITTGSVNHAGATVDNVKANHVVNAR